ncbi:agmatinase [Natronorubrum sp. JWXQ-INN-674]|uniref:Agmatinase n=1 Tax=Natronorubrum halalkaliphilum TaxID=2691917 RepID=A0A6B0VIN7_9EURY|nr:agmatinase family protein [Natronorubrum halalkaliphilum]MXV60672.1 agmatinase [Natronorubrum halalkaliphilum]
MRNRQRERAAAFRESTTGADVELAYAGFNRFLKGEEREVDDVGDVDAAVLGAPYDGAVSNRPGSRYGPAAIREASGWWAYISDYKGGLTNMQTGKTVNFDDLSVADCGDVPIFPMDHETTAESITSHVAAVASQTFPVLLGGDHYCTFPSVRGFAEGADHDSVGFVQIDAHTDTVSESPVFGTDFHGSSTALIADSPYVDYENVSQVGIRGYESPDFFEFADETGLNLYTMREVDERGIGSVVTDAIEAAAADTDAVYVSFDIDGVDPSVAPGTGTPIPGGLSAQQALETMEVLGAHDAVGAADLMEVAPRYDSTEGTQRLAAYLLVTLLERAFAE